MESTVESLCNQLARNRLMDGAAIRYLRSQWRAEAGANADDFGQFRQWLIRGGQVSEFQLDMLARGYGDFLNFGEYKLQDRIGTGRMAGVYKAVHPLGQTVAIKVLPPAMAKQPKILGRFRREARMAVKLGNDHVVRTFQTGLHNDMHYLVMEFLDGETLEETLQRRRRLPLLEAVPILMQALEGLDHLHEVGLVHRDLKPANLMLVPGDTAGDSTLNATVKILDMGLSRALFDEGTPGAGEQAAPLTSLGTLVGTINYMAPEQARSAHQADIRADIYSLGCVFYEMLTGQPPFPDTNFAKQIRRHAEEKPRPLMEMVPGLPAAVDHIVQKMLAKDPALRYPTPGQVLKDLKALALPTPAAKPVRPLRSYLTWLETQPKDAAPEPESSWQMSDDEEVLALTAVMPNKVNSLPLAKPVAAPAPLPFATPITPDAPPPPAEPILAPAVDFHASWINHIGTFAKFTWQRIRAGWNRRDWIAAAVGAGAIILLLGILWLLRVVFG